MTFPTASPSSQGVRPAGLLALVDAFDAHPTVRPHGLIVQRHGRRVLDASWAPHTPDRARLVYSLSKSFLGVAVGLAVAEGRLDLDDLVVDHLPEAAVGADERVGRMRVRHLASMSTGHDRDMVLDALIADPQDPVRGFLSLRPAHEPGSRFAYNQPPAAVLSTILERLTGVHLVEYLRPRLLDPLGIGDLRWADLRPGVALGFSGVYTTLDAVARLGQLHLDQGRWEGRRLVPASWIADAARRHIASPGEPNPDWREGYGLQLWMSRHGYRGDGAFGQLMVVLPEHDTVVAMFAHVVDMQPQLDAIWEHLLPALAGEGQPLGETEVDETRLADRLAGLAQPTARQRTSGAAGPAPEGRFAPAPFGSASHTTVTAIDVEGDEMVLHEGDRAVRVTLGDGWSVTPDPPLAASAACLADGTCVVDLILLATPHRLTVTLDPASTTFATSWPASPIFGAGVGFQLAEMRPPPPSA